METKFQIGDILVRSAYKNSKSALMRDEILIVQIISDGHPICPQTWYITQNTRDGKIRSGLKCVIEDAFEKIS